ncbi:MAG TPA: hypothetical protein VMR45_01235 [Patescibacteria group bacterium]|nr:hypothetical protein [Patescibacteria group bacterium]
MLASTLTGLVLAIGTALVTSILTYHFTNKATKAAAVLRFREEKYAKLLVLLEGFVGNTASAETKRAFFKEQHESWLYCSDEVTQAINHLIEVVAGKKGIIHIKDEDPVGAIVLAMRKDLLGKTKLGTSDFRYIDVIDRK